MLEGDAPPVEVVAQLIIKTLFADGLKGHLNYIAMQTVCGALSVWRGQLLQNKSEEADRWRKMFHEEKMRADELRTQLLFAESDRAGKIVVSG